MALMARTSALNCAFFTLNIRIFLEYTCRVEFGDMSDLNAELESQTEDKWDDWDNEDDEIQF